MSSYTNETIVNTNWKLFLSKKVIGTYENGQFIIDKNFLPG